ncbi:Tll0287-like domain-containing protein [Algoriphagus namhaensis]
MKKIAWNYLIIGFGVLLSACGSGERVSKEVFDEVNANMEVKRLTEAEILQEAMIWGDSISTEAQRQLITALQNAIAEGGPAGAIDFCHVNALPILAEVAEPHSITIRRASNRYRNPADQPTEREKPILEAYEYNAENGISSDPNIQKFDGGETYLYTKAIVIPGGFCLSCHGDPGKDIDEATLSKIQELYPEDKATGHEVGDLRGMWSLQIPKSEVVKRM